MKKIIAMCLAASAAVLAVTPFAAGTPPSACCSRRDGR